MLNSLKSIINEYVGELTEMLVKKKISEENRKLFKQGLINELSGRLNAVTVAIASHTIDKAPAGQQMHWSLFKTTFEKRSVTLILINCWKRYAKQQAVIKVYVTLLYQNTKF